MDIRRSGSRPSARPDPASFTDTVRLDPVVEAAEPARVRAAVVTFEPGARTGR